MGVGAAMAGDQLGNQWTNNQNLSAPGWVQNTLSHMDPLGNQITKFGGDPLNLYGHKNNPNALLFPSSAQPNAGGPFPNLGPQSLIPVMPGGAFQHMQPGAGPYNQMAATGAGGVTFNPQAVHQNGFVSNPQAMMPNTVQTPGMGSKPIQGPNTLNASPMIAKPTMPIGVAKKRY